MQGWERTVLDCGAPCCTIIVFPQVCRPLHVTGQMLLCIFIWVSIRLDKTPCAGNSRAEIGHSGLAPLFGSRLFVLPDFCPCRGCAETKYHLFNFVFNLLFLIDNSLDTLCGIFNVVGFVNLGLDKQSFQRWRVLILSSGLAVAARAPPPPVSTTCHEQ